MPTEALVSNQTPVLIDDRILLMGLDDYLTDFREHLRLTRFKLEFRSGNLEDYGDH